MNKNQTWHLIGTLTLKLNVFACRTVLMALIHFCLTGRTA